MSAVRTKLTGVARFQLLFGADVHRGGRWKAASSRRGVAAITPAREHAGDRS
jgi:hypothetical protein